MDYKQFELRQTRRELLARGIELIEEATSKVHWLRGFAVDALQAAEWDLEEFTYHYVTGVCSGA
jgi:hypothetical protein